MTAKVSKKNSFSTLSYQVLWLGSGIRPPRTIPLGPEFGQNYITTTFNERHEGGISEVFNRLSSQSTVDVNFREWIHSHPGNTNWPSGFDNDTHEFKGSGDMQVAKSVTEGLSKVNWNIPIFKIYPIKDRKYVIFNAKSTRYDFY